MLVSRGDLEDVCRELRGEDYLGLDTETYGLNWTDEMFSLILCNGVKSYYFNFYSGLDHLGQSPLDKYCLDKETTLKGLWPIFLDPKKTLFMHNAKFDMRRLDIEGVYFDCKIHCTMACERILDNTLLSYSLENVAKRYGLKKDTGLDAYLKEHKLYRKVGDDNVPCYYLVPLDRIAVYGMQDGFVTYGIGDEQLTRIGL